MKQVIWIVYTTLCILVFGLPLFRTAHTENTDLSESCPAGYAFEATYGVCTPVEKSTSTVPSNAALCDDGRILLGRSECGASTLAWFGCPAGAQIHVEEKPLPSVLTALPIPPIGKHGKRYVWCGTKYETEQVYSGSKFHAN